MNMSSPITATHFSAFLNCPMKAHLLAIGEPREGTFFADMEARISSSYKANATQKVRDGEGTIELLSFGDLRDNQDRETIISFVDCETAVYDFALLPNEPECRQALRSGTFV